MTKEKIVLSLWSYLYNIIKYMYIYKYICLYVYTIQYTYTFLAVLFVDLFALPAVEQ